MHKLRDTLYFYILLLVEVITFSFITEYLKRLPFFRGVYMVRKQRRNPLFGPVNVIIHEWGGYSPLRVKKLKNGTKFTCGLEGQLMRFLQYKGKYKIILHLTMSDIGQYPSDLLNKISVPIIIVPNEGYDFAGYATFYSKIASSDDTYVILTNTSVNRIQNDFFDGYIDYMNKNLDVAMMGISYCTKCYQSFIRNNFHPHLQSYFILTTKEILDEIVKENDGIFPGQGITNKRLLIREGEIKISRIALKLGYSLAVVLETGQVFKFKQEYSFYNGYREWKNMKHGDMRSFVCNPNAVTPITG